MVGNKDIKINIYDLTGIRMTTIKKQKIVFVRMCRNPNPVHCRWECEMVQLLYEAVWQLLKKLKLELSYGPAIPLLVM